MGMGGGRRGTPVLSGGEGGIPCPIQEKKGR